MSGQRRRIFEKKALSAERDDIAAGWRKLHSDILQNVDFLPDIYVRLV